jgi:hypothetical protein
MESRGGDCVDLRLDPTHCGGCGLACGAGDTCCDGGCVDTQTDEANCGACENSCFVTEVCCDGACTVGECCADADCAECTFCSGDFTCDPVTDLTICGAAGVCCAGVCIEGGVCCADTDCPVNVCCGGVCCPPGQGCVGGVCGN